MSLQADNQKQITLERAEAETQHKKRVQEDRTSRVVEDMVAGMLQYSLTAINIQWCQYVFNESNIHSIILIFIQ